jgi:hypothetical protein
MPRESALVAALSQEPVSTSALYERVGYATLTKLGLIPYPAFRAALSELETSGRAHSEIADDGSTMWSRPATVG